MAVLAHAVLAAAGLEMLLIAEIDQRIEAGDRLGNDITAVPAVAAIRAAEFDELLAPERNAAVPARAGLNIDLGLVEKFHAPVCRRPGVPERKRASRGACIRLGASWVPLRRLAALPGT